MLKSAANAATGGVLNAAFSGHQDARQLDQQAKLQRQQIEGARELKNMDMANQLAMMKAQYGANIAGMKEAGLSPALMYGGAGQGGATAGQGGMPTAGTAGDPNAGVANSIQLGMMKAQTENIEADTEMKKATATKTAGVDTEATAANTALTQLKSDLAEIEKGLQNRTLDQQVNIIWQQSQEAEGRAMEQVNKGVIARETVQDEIKRIKQEATNSIIAAAAMKQGIELDSARIEEITTSIMQRWKQLNLTETANNWEHQDRVKAIEDYSEAMLWGAGIQGVTNVARTAAEVIIKKPGVPKWSQTGKSLKTEYGANGEALKQTRYEQWKKR